MAQPATGCRWPDFIWGKGRHMAAEDQNGKVTTQGTCTDCTERERSFDALARRVANGSISRRRALGLLGGALLGGAVASIPGMGWLSGNSGEAQALTPGPGGSLWANSGQSCNAQKCCAGLTCIGKPGNRVCCPEERICGQICCPLGATCFNCPPRSLV